MFDDHTPQGGTVPPNLPLGEPEDIFAAVEPEEELSAPKPLLEEVPASAPLDTAPSSLPPVKTALTAGALKPKSEPGLNPPVLEAAPPAPASEIFDQPPTHPPATPVAPSPVAVQHAPQTHALPTDAPEMYAVKEPRASKGIITAIIIIIVVLILGGGGIFVYNQFVLNAVDSDIPAELDTLTEDALPIAETDIFEEIDTTGLDDELVSDGDTMNNDAKSNTDQDILFGEPVDTDADGLDDERESDIGTDAAHWDTDGDELSDGDEVIIWKTDPLNPDSDGDGFDDGAEIKSGYSPTGPGKIFEPPVSVPTSTP